jgi:hemerythrin superfamily protein
MEAREPVGVARVGRSRQLERRRLGVDIYSLIRDDHQRVMALFDELQKSEDAHERERLFDRLKKEILTHKEAEERTFYAALSMLPELVDRIEEAMEEHADQEELLEELDGLDTEDEDFTVQLNELREEVEHHVSEEENEIFSRAQQHLTAEQARKIAKEMLAEKEKVSV